MKIVFNHFFLGLLLMSAANYASAMQTGSAAYSAAYRIYWQAHDAVATEQAEKEARSKDVMQAIKKDVDLEDQYYRALHEKAHNAGDAALDTELKGIAIKKCEAYYFGSFSMKPAGKSMQAICKR